MKLRKLIADLPEEKLGEIARRVVQGAEEQAPHQWARAIETVLTGTGRVEQQIFAARPPVASVILALVEAEDNSATREVIRQRVDSDAESWASSVTSGELCHRNPDRSRIYMRILEAAWSNDLTLDPSEVRMLGLLREELGLLRMEHFLLAYHQSISPLLGDGDPLEFVIAELSAQAIVFEVGDNVVLPEELTDHARRALGVEVDATAAARLYGRLDSIKHLKAALRDHDLRTSGSKDDRIARLTRQFVPVSRVVDTMHISDARDLARSLSIPISGPKDELVQRIVTHFARNADLGRQEEQEAEEVVREERELGESQFKALFGALRGRELQQLLLRLDLRHSGSKEVRLEVLRGSHLSERNLLCKLKGGELDALLARFDLVERGNKSDKVSALVKVALAEGTKAAADAESELLLKAGQLINAIELSSKSPTRFDELRTYLSTLLPVSFGDISIKYLADPKNYRNRVGEAFRNLPEVFVAIIDADEAEAVAQGIKARAALSPETVSIILSRAPGTEAWACTTIFATGETKLLKAVGRLFPSAPPTIAAIERPHTAEDLKDISSRLKTALDREAEPLGHSEDSVYDALASTFGSSEFRIRTKHVSENKNLGNRIAEALGAGCAGLVLVVASDLAESAQQEVSRQISILQHFAVAVVLPEVESGGYGRPRVVTGSARRDEEVGSAVSMG